jgi:hypothetical protein
MNWKEQSGRKDLSQVYICRLAFKPDAGAQDSKNEVLFLQITISYRAMCF